MPKHASVELADILRQQEKAGWEQHGLNLSQRKVWRAITACRTAALGGHIERCDQCQTTRHIYHSCRNRHYPKCQSRTKDQWLAARQRECLSVPYTHLVFTIPHALNGLAVSHFRMITDILFSASAETLLAFAANSRWLGGVPAITLVLHTWTQTLQRHLHIHALMPNGVLTEDGQWKQSRRGFLFPVKALSKVFREKFIDALKLARADDRIPKEMMDDQAWKHLLIELRRHDWVVYAKAPLGGPQQVLDYLSRYTHRVGISNERLLSFHDGLVRFKVRDNTHAGKKRVAQLPASEFTRRFLQHVLPTGFKRIRHYGVLANCHKKEKLAQCRLALQMSQPQPAIIEGVQAFMLRVSQIDILRCPHCGLGAMQVIEVIVAAKHRPVLTTGPPP
ncbi:MULTISPECIES: IS91 family transposase [Undibacterium]|uniref:IS91 family transposase n=1 Tax=Undibacterium TaxID=401469 RepID=UPI001E32A279|nr:MULTISPECIES: IS91 family transposase [Undibacterium]